MLLANEVTSPPTGNTNLGPRLTFDSANTGLSRSFRVETLQPGAGFTFNDNEGPPLHIILDALSVGDINDFEDDDFVVTRTDGPTLHGYGFFLNDNVRQAGESLNIYGPRGVLLGSTTDIPGTNGVSAFMGVISRVPITRIEFEESHGGDDILIKDFHFAVPQVGNLGGMTLLVGTSGGTGTLDVAGDIIGVDSLNVGVDGGTGEVDGTNITAAGGALRVGGIINLNPGASDGVVRASGDVSGFGHLLVGDSTDSGTGLVEVGGSYTQVGGFVGIGLGNGNTGTVTTTDLSITELAHIYVGHGGGHGTLIASGVGNISLASITEMRVGVNGGTGLVEVTNITGGGEALSSLRVGADGVSFSIGGGNGTVRASGDVSGFGSLHVGDITDSEGLLEVGGRYFQDGGQVMVGVGGTGVVETVDLTLNDLTFGLQVGTDGGDGKLTAARVGSISLGAANTDLLVGTVGGTGLVQATHITGSGSGSNLNVGTTGGHGTVTVTDGTINGFDRVNIGVSGPIAVGTSIGQLNLTDTRLDAQDMLIGLGDAEGTVRLNPSRVELTGDLILGEGGRLIVGIEGTTRADGSGGPDQFSAINADMATLGGTLDVALTSGFVPQWGDTFDVVTSPTITGNFSDFDGNVFRLEEIGQDDIALVPQVFNNVGGSDTDVVRLTTTGMGDANVDGRVTFADFSALQLHFGEEGDDIDWFDGDFTGDGRVTFADFSLLQLNFGDIFFTLPGSSFTADLELGSEADLALFASQLAIPEPGSAVVMVIGGLLLSRPKKRVGCG